MFFCVEYNRGGNPKKCSSYRLQNLKYDKSRLRPVNIHTCLWDNEKPPETDKLPAPVAFFMITKIKQ